MLYGVQRDRFISQLRALNDVLEDDSLFENKWRKFLASRRNYYRSNMLGLNRYVGFYGKKASFSVSLFEARNQRVILNIMRCDAHREALIDILREGR